jgi:hypothetical protein
MAKKMDKKILLLGQNNEVSEHIRMCLQEDALDVEFSDSFLDQIEPDIVIINLFNFDEDIEVQLSHVLESNVEKIILLENALDLYLNSKNKLPFSVYSQLIPSNEVCERYLEIERKIIESKKQHVIFRISEMYGLSSPQSLVEKLLFASSGEFENSSHDFIYDGDVISAIEISLRKEVNGMFDIASGHSIELRKLMELIKKMRQIEDEIKWKRKKLEIAFNCNNFKFYKWEPLVNIEMGLKTLFTIRRRNGQL